MRSQIRQIVAALLTVLVAHPCVAAEAQADSPDDKSPESTVPAAAVTSAQPAAASESRWRLGIALGYGLRSNPLVQSDDIPIIVDIDLSWFGDRFFFDNGDLGFTFVDNEFVTTSLVGRVNSDRVFFGRTNTKFVNVDLAGAPLASEIELTIPDRDYAAELGFELLADGSWGTITTDGVSRRQQYP